MQPISIIDYEGIYEILFQISYYLEQHQNPIIIYEGIGTKDKHCILKSSEDQCMLQIHRIFFDKGNNIIPSIVHLRHPNVSMGEFVERDMPQLLDHQVEPAFM